MKTFLKIALIGSALAVTACTGTGLNQKNGYQQGEDVIRDLVGKGACLNCYGLFVVADQPKAFALSPSGAFGYANERESLAEAREGAMNMCQIRNSEQATKPCKLLVVNDQFVWNN